MAYNNKLWTLLDAFAIETDYMGHTGILVLGPAIARKITGSRLDLEIHKLESLQSLLECQSINQALVVLEIFFGNELLQ